MRIKIALSFAAMMVLLPMVVVLAVTCIFLLRWGMNLRRSLRESLHGATTSRCAELEELAILRGTNATLERHNRRLQTRLDEAQQELGALSYSISHDLRAPLRSINGFSQALAEDYRPRLDATAQDYLRRLRTGALHLNALIDELLALARIARAPFQVGPVDLAALARQIAGDLSANDPARRVDWKVPSSLPVQGDPALLAIALRHLLENAWKFSAGRLVTQIGVRSLTPEGAGLESSAVVYEIRDNGVGFDMQYAGKLFGAFQRLHAAEEFPGHGTGLAAVQRIIRRHGGRVWATAEPGEGAVFSFTLDADADDLPESHPTRTAMPLFSKPSPGAASTPEPKPSVA